MSIASYFFVGNDDEARRNDGLAGGPDDRRAEFYRVTDISLKPLYEVISGEPCAKFVPVAMSDDFAQITFAFPKKFVESLAPLEHARIDGAIAQWRKSPDCPYDNDADLRDLVRKLISLAKLSSERGRGMYLWNST